MSSPEYLKAFKALMRSDPNPIHIAQIYQEFYVAGARPAAIVQASLIDTILEDLLKRKMRHDLTNDVISRMFDGNGPLSSFSNKIDMAFALNQYGRTTFRDLHNIRELRNGFAHTRHPIDFTTPQVVDICRHLKIVDNNEFRRVPDISIPGAEYLSDLTNPRTRYTVTCNTISTWLLYLVGTESSIQVPAQCLP